MEKKRKYTSNDITVFWRPSECIHSSICYTKLYRVFNPGRRPWIMLDNAGTDEVIAIVNECPTRALTFMWNDPDKNAAETSLKAEKDEAVLKEFEKATDDAHTPEIKVMPNGPLIVTGDFKLFDNEGNEMKKMKMASLCRCGYTNSPPFCDGNHFKHRFRDE